MKNHPKEKKERDQKILKEQKKFKEWEIISDLIYQEKIKNILLRYKFDAGWSSLVARQAHNLKVVGSNPTPATNQNNVSSSSSYI